MIAKRVRRQGKTSEPSRLVRYMVAAQGGLDPCSWKRTADYILDSKSTTSQGEKVSSYRVTNCGTDDPVAAVILIEVTQEINRRSNADKTYHLVFSFPPGEEPALDVLHIIEDELCASIGYADHQRISAVHVDTEHMHVHVAINKVHPTGHQNVEPFYDKRRLMEACERLELQYGLQRTNHGFGREGGSTVPISQEVMGKCGTRPGTVTGGKAADMEAHSGVRSLEGYVANEAGEAIQRATTWKEVHAALAAHGLQIKPRGAGLVIGDAEQGVWCRASNCGRGMSMKGLTSRLGAFEYDDKRNLPPVRKRYEPRPLQRHPSSGALFARFQQQQQLARAARKKGLVEIRAERTRENERIRQWSAAQRAIIKAGPPGSGKKVLYANVKALVGSAHWANLASADAKSKALITETSLPNWKEWLMARAESGDQDALAVLRFRAEREERMRGDLLTTERAEHAKAVIMASLKPKAHKDGTMAYRTADGGLVLDRVSHVQAEQVTAGAALVALSLAAERFGGCSLDVRGTEQFRRDVVRLAALHKVKVTFSDAAMEMERRAAMPQHDRQVVSSPSDLGSAQAPDRGRHGGVEI